MAELSTVEIHSPKNASQRWIINQDDYDPEKHRLWGEPEEPIGVDSNGTQFTQSDLDRSVIRQVSEHQYMMETPDEPEEPKSVEVAHKHIPSVPDYVTDDAGDIVSVNVIDPERRNARKEIPFEDYDPDAHELWSTHPRFNR